VTKPEFALPSTKVFSLAVNVVLLVCFLTVFDPVSFAQDTEITPPSIPVGSTITTDGIESINLSNLGIHFKIPIHARPGRGIPFSTDLDFDNAGYATKATEEGLAWTVYGLSHPLNGPLGLFYWSFVTHAPQQCQDPDGNYFSYNLVTVSNYIDGHGVTHPFGPLGFRFTTNPAAHAYCNIPLAPVTATAFDGSGIKATVSYGQGTVTYPNGTVIDVPFFFGGQLSGSPLSVTDSNGNWITESFVSGQRELSSFTDTLGTNPFALTSTSGAYPNPVSFAYNNSSGTQASPFTKSFANYTVQTAFGCSNIIDLSRHEFLAAGQADASRWHILCIHL